jgi:hypothetical protein
MGYVALPRWVCLLLHIALAIDPTPSCRLSGRYQRNQQKMQLVHYSGVVLFSGL